jgi:type IV secretion system protein VirB9
MKTSLLTLAIISMTSGTFAESTSAALSTTPATVEAMGANVSTPTSTAALNTLILPAVRALPLQPAPAKQTIAATSEVLTPPPMLPTATVQIRKLSAADAARLSAAQRWEQTGVADALVGAGGAVEYPYGYSRPTITCAPLHVCSVALQDGEAATSVSIGDTVRWLLQTATAGTKPVMMIKPTQAGLSTNLVVTTDKGRIYYMHLVSNKTEYVPMVSWYDPAAMTRDLSAEAQTSARQKAEFDATIAATKLAAEQAKAQRVVADKSVGKLDPTTLDFGYTCTGEAAFKPARVFANDTHTFIQLPPSASASDAPAVFNVSNNETELLNSRLVNGYYIIDGKPAKLSLVLGVGASAQTVKCQKSVPNSLFSWGTK